MSARPLVSEFLGASNRTDRTYEGAEASGQSVARSRLLSILVFLTLATAPIKGYLQDASPGLSKLVPVLLFVGWLVHLLHRRRLPCLHTVSWLVVGLAVVVALSSAANTDNAYVLDYDIRWLPFLAITFVLVDLLANVVEIWVAVLGVIVGALISAGGALFSFLFLHVHRATGPLQDPNDLAYVLVAALPFLLFAAPGARASVRFVQVVGVLLLVAGAAATLSRGAVIASLVTIAWAGARRLVSFKFIVGALLLAAACASALWIFSPPVLETALSQKDFVAQSNIHTRELRWAAAGRLLAEHPVLGVGPGGARDYYVAASDNAELTEQTPVTHNMYLEVGAELGLAGLALFGAMIVVAFAASESAVHGPRRPWALGVQGSLIMVCVASTFLSEEYYMPLWAGVALAAAVTSRASVRNPTR